MEYPKGLDRKHLRMLWRRFHFAQIFLPVVNTALVILAAKYLFGDLTKALILGAIYIVSCIILAEMTLRARAHARGPGEHLLHKEVVPGSEMAEYWFRRLREVGYAPGAILAPDDDGTIIGISYSGGTPLRVHLWVDSESTEGLSWPTIRFCLEHEIGHLRIPKGLLYESAWAATFPSAAICLVFTVMRSVLATYRVPVFPGLLMLCERVSALGTLIHLNQSEEYLADAIAAIELGGAEHGVDALNDMLYYWAMRDIFPSAHHRDHGHLALHPHTDKRRASLNALFPNEKKPVPR